MISTFVWLVPFLSPLCYSHPPITPDDGSDYAIYVVIYIFATIGGVLVITIFFLIIAILVVRHRKNTKGDPPLLSEEQKIAVMKQTGYVNPTYKFFDQTVESWVLLYWLCNVHCMYVQPSLNFFCLKLLIKRCFSCIALTFMMYIHTVLWKLISDDSSYVM